MDSPPALALSRVIRGLDIGVLRDIHHPEVDLALWHRRMPTPVDAWLDGLPPKRLPNWRILVRVGDASHCVHRVFTEAGTGRGAHGADLMAALANDVAMLATRFAAIADTDIVDIRLDALDHDGCWKFHRDCVSMRLLTSYRGPGTEFVAAPEARRALALQRKFDGTVERMPRYAVGLFKGDCDRPGQGLVHRSPPVAGTDTTRLLLCINPPSHASPDLWAP